MSTRTKLVAPLVLWTWLVWGSRIRNIVGNDELTDTGQAVRILIALVFLSLGVATAARMWRWRSEALTQVDRNLIVAFVVWSVGFWLVRGVGIMFDDRTFGFIAIHAVLMLISIALALNAVRVLSNPSISSSRVAAQ